MAAFFANLFKTIREKWSKMLNFIDRLFFSESVENCMSNKMSQQKFESDKRYRFFIGEIISSKNS